MNQAEIRMFDTINDLYTRGFRRAAPIEHAIADLAIYDAHGHLYALVLRKKSKYYARKLIRNYTSGTLSGQSNEARYILLYLDAEKELEYYDTATGEQVFDPVPYLKLLAPVVPCYDDLAILLRYIRKCALSRSNVVDLLQLAYQTQQGYLVDTESFINETGLDYSLATYLKNGLADFDFRYFPPEAVSDMLNETAGTYGYIWLGEFAVSTLNLQERERLCLPFCPDIALPYLLAQRISGLQITIFCSDQALVSALTFFLNLFEVQYDLVLTSPQEALLLSQPCDKLILTPPLDQDIADKDFLQKFTLYQMRPRNRMKLSLLALESYLYYVEPGGKALVLVDHSFTSSRNEKQARQYLLEHAGIGAVVSFPSGVLHPKWGYQVDMLLLDKDRGTGMTLLASMQEFSREELMALAEEYLKGEAHAF